MMTTKDLRLGDDVTDFAEALFDITNVADFLCGADRISLSDSRELCFTCIELAKQFVVEERNFVDHCDTLLNCGNELVATGPDSDDTPNLAFLGKFRDLWNEFYDRVDDLHDDFRDNYMTRVEEFAIRELTKRYGKEA